MKFLQFFFQNEQFFVENSNLTSTYFHLEVDPRKLVRWSVQPFASQNGLCVLNFHFFYFKVYYFWWEIWILSEEILKLNWTPKKLNVHEWLIWVIFTWKYSDLYASQNGLRLMNFSDFFSKVNYFWWGVQILSERSSKLKWTPEELNVHEWLISVIFR